MASFLFRAATTSYFELNSNAGDVKRPGLEVAVAWHLLCAHPKSKFGAEPRATHVQGRSFVVKITQAHTLRSDTVWILANVRHNLQPIATAAPQIQHRSQ